MAHVVGRSADQAAPIPPPPFAPKERGGKRVDDRKVLRSIIPATRSGLRRVDAGGRWPPQNPLQPLPPLVRQGCF